ncbi:MAG: heme ABC exporter ATP-binding protein CcmA [Desulfovibrionaceae bacterium]|jgi:heme exporter protein A|uniref:heme ABC exporter ATP-binding protein CcmA n=1 Tax=Desulfovibrio aminophilus TaxID=81425 RepID=UPI00042818FE|nr:heme ABC exporter ATP-binding protein CcmA [Desulfovibrio aminophilus]MDY0304971.1 heme ABC exporter ATP-binding protein CcmA [Desulfovibrionaceae bacterium]
MNAAPVLSARRLTKFYGDKLVFRDVSMELGPGRVLLVVGGNGAGKSTLLKILAGLLKPSEGEVESGAAEGRTAYLGHATFIYPRLSARDNLAFWARMYGLPADEDRLGAALARVGLARVAQERAGGFSRGMAQRLNLARVFLVEPELLFLDEPGTGLDAASQDILRAEIAGLRQRGAAVVWVSHDLAGDRDRADLLLALDRGRRAFFGPAADYRPEAPSC